MSDYATRQLRNRDMCKGTIISTFSSARIFKQPHQTIIDRLRVNVRQSRQYNSLSQYYKGYLEGLIESHYDNIWHNHLTFQYRNLATNEWENANTITHYVDHATNQPLYDFDNSRHIWTNSNPAARYY